MKIIALYKTFDGGEFVDASLASIYEHCDHIVMVHSDVSWLGERGNTVREPAVKWCEQHDKSGKVHHVNVECSNQEEQYQKGIDYIDEKGLKYDLVMAIDADEVWEDQYFERAEEQIYDNPFPAFKCGMHTYLKTPFYRIEPPFGTPTAFFRDPSLLTKSPRGCSSTARHLDNVWMHHFTYVRNTRADVERKIHQSCRADGNETVIPGWMEDVYDQLPEFNGSGLHSFERHRNVWQGIQKVYMSDLPEAMRNANLFKLWWPSDKLLGTGGVETGWQSMLAGEKDAIYRLAKGRKQAVDLGTYRGVSAVVLALACEKVHTVDFYEGCLEDKSSEYATIGGHSLANTQAICERFGNMTCESSDTVDAARRWRGLVDVLFVDADHSYEGVMRDVQAWMTYMQPGGRIIFHDDNEIHPGVQRALNELRYGYQFAQVDAGPFNGSVTCLEVK